HVAFIDVRCVTAHYPMTFGIEDEHVVVARLGLGYERDRLAVAAHRHRLNSSFTAIDDAVAPSLRRVVVVEVDEPYRVVLTLLLDVGDVAAEVVIATASSVP